MFAATMMIEEGFRITTEWNGRSYIKVCGFLLDFEIDMKN